MAERTNKQILADSQIDPRTQERRSAASTLGLLRAQASGALELKQRDEAMAKQGTRAPTQKRYLIGLISCLLPIADLSHPVFEKMLLGIRGRLTANSSDLLLCATRPLGANAELRRDAAMQTIERGVDGLIAWGIAKEDPECAPILDSGLPVMFTDNDIIGARAGSVMSANVDGMAKAMSHLYETGRRRIAHITGHFETRPGVDRLFGYRSEIGRLGLPELPEYIVEGDFFHESGYRAMQQLLALPTPPDAVTCASDAMAAAAIAAIEEAGLNVPGDIAVTGFDDADFAQAMIPSLTTLRQDALGMGSAAAEAVLRMLSDSNSSPSVVLIPTELVIRESSGPAVSR